MYCAIIADIQGSRTIEDRFGLQEKLESVLNELNNDYQGEIKSPFQITLGDEFQGLLSRPDAVLDITGKIRRAMQPHKLRIGIGLGTMRTVIHEDSPLGSDGPAYYAARDAIDKIKKAESQYGTIKSDVWILADDQKSACIDLINSTLALCWLLESKWTARQLAVIELVEAHGYTQAQVSEQLGIDRSTVNRHLAASSYVYYHQAKETVRDALNDLWETMQS